MSFACSAAPVDEAVPLSRMPPAKLEAVMCSPGRAAAMSACSELEVEADAHVDHLRQVMRLVVDQQVGHAERLAADVEAAVGGGDQLGGVGLGDDDLAERIVEPERRRLVLRHLDRAHGRVLHAIDGERGRRVQRDQGERGARGQEEPPGGVGGDETAHAQNLAVSFGTLTEAEASPLTTVTEAVRAGAAAWSPRARATLGAAGAAPARRSDGGHRA